MALRCISTFKESFRKIADDAAINNQFWYADTLYSHTPTGRTAQLVLPMRNLGLTQCDNCV